MPYAHYQKDLNTALESEVLGKIVFETAANYARSTEQQHKWLLLAQLEIQTLQRLQAFLSQHQLRANIRPHIKAQAKVSGIAMARLPWKLSMRLLKQGTQPFMQAFERMNQHADADTREFLSYLLAHEQALATFAHDEMNGKAQDAAMAIENLLKK